MKFWKWILYLGLAVFLCGFATVVFVLTFFDGGPERIHMEIYEAPKTGAQAIVLTDQDFSGDTESYVGVRAFKGENWHLYSHFYLKDPKLPIWCEVFVEDRDLGCWRWQDADIKKLRRNWKD